MKYELTYEEAVSLLPEKCREIFEKSREENLTNKQIAATMNISEKTVETNSIKLARKPLVEAERDDAPNEGHIS